MELALIKNCSILLIGSSGNKGNPLEVLANFQVLNKSINFLLDASSTNKKASVYVLYNF